MVDHKLLRHSVTQFPAALLTVCLMVNRGRGSTMARVKNICRPGLGPRKTTNLPIATFGKRPGHPSSRTVRINCPICELELSRANLSRHIKRVHPASRTRVDIAHPDEGVATSNFTHPDEGVATSNFIQPDDVGDATSNFIQPDDVGVATPNFTSHVQPDEPLKLVIQLPAVERALNSVSGGPCFTNSASRASPGGPSDRSPLTGHLPTTPAEEDRDRCLARLYSKRMANGIRGRLPYDHTALLLETAKDLSLRTELRSIMEQAGLVLQTNEEYELSLRRGGAQPVSPRPAATASRVEDPGLPVGTQTEFSSTSSPVVSQVPPPFVCSTTFQEGQPQSLSLNTGGVWGIQITPYRL